MSGFAFGQLGVSINLLTNWSTWYTRRPLGQSVNQHTKLIYWPIGQPISQAVNPLAYVSTYRPKEIFGVWVGTHIHILFKIYFKFLLMVDNNTVKNLVPFDYCSFSLTSSLNMMLLSAKLMPAALPQSR